MDRFDSRVTHEAQESDGETRRLAERYVKNLHACVEIRSGEVPDALAS
jgi:hypothetical protein